MARESVGYYALPIIPSFKGVESGISSRIKSSFGQTGTQAGRLMGDNVAKGLEAARGKVDSATAKHAKAIDRVKDAAGKSRVEIQRLNEAINAGASGSRLTAQSERVATALRREAEAARQAKTAETQLANARRSLSSTGGPGAGINPLAEVEQNMQGSSSGLTAFAGGLGTKIGGAFMGAFSAAAGVAAIGALLKSAVATGTDFERTINAFSGVTAQAGDTAQIAAARMDAMRTAARNLGTDTSLAGVSARDAGAAMLELAKGGLTAEQAMEAARGTLQLSIAGQLDAAEAAQIQSAALNTFQLDASNAGRVADLLAAAANASSADVHDLGLALKQAGAVASGFGTSVEDTLTALTMFSRFGINGSDAGTMLKTSLQSITDQGKPAQSAIEALGLTLYDSNRQFVGVESMMKQVAAAATRMSEEEFQAATNVLFGSDAMRASMVAAKGGAKAWDDSAAAVRRQGAAAEMAAAQMQGMPGVVESLSNVWEGFKLKLFDVIDGPLIAVGNWFTDVLSGGGPQGMKDFLGAMAEAMRSVGSVIGQYLMPALRELWDNLKGPLMQYGRQWVETLKSAMPAMKAVGAVIGVVLLGALKALSIALPIAVRALTAIITVAQKVYQHIGRGISVIQPVASFIGGVFVGAWNLLKGAISAAWSVIKPVFDGVKDALGFISDAARYAFDTVIIPMWHNFQTVAGAAWSVVSPIFEALREAWGGVADAVRDFWQGTIVPAWEGIKNAFTGGWSAIEPIFENIKGGFQGVKDFVSGVWSGLAGVVKGAFDAIINAVKGPLRWIGGLLQQVPTSIGSIEIPGAQAAQDLGNTLAGLRSGTDRRGVLFGPGNGTSDSILGVDAKTGRATAFVSAGEGVVRADAMKRGGGKLVAALNAGWTPSADYLHSMVPGMKTGGVISSEEQSRLAGGTINASILAALRAVNPSAKLTSAVTDHDDDGGFHPKKMAIDVDPSPANLDALWKMRDKLTQIIFDDPKRVWYNVGGQRAEGAAARAIYGETTMSQHRNHIHVAAAGEVPVPGGRRRGRRGATRSALGSLSASSSPEDVAAAIVSEAQSRGFNEEETKAILATALQESGLNPAAAGGAGAWHGIFQQDQSYPGRDDPNKNIGEFFNRLGGPGGDIWRKIFTLQQGSPPESGRSGYMREIQSQSGRAEELYNQVVSSVGTEPGSTFLGYEPADPKKIREAEDRLADRERDVQEKQALVDERQRKLDAAKPAQRETAQRLLDNAKADLEKANRERDEAKADLEEARQGTPKYGTDDTSTSTSLGGEKDTGGGESQLSEVGSIFKQFLADTFGFGDLLPDPSQLGIVKLASAIMGIKYTPTGKGFPWQTGYAGGNGMPWSGNPFAATGASPGGAVTDILGGLIPGVNIPPPPEGDQHMPPGATPGVAIAPGQVDQSTNITINSPQGDPKDIENRTRRTLLNTPRLNTYTGPGPAGP